MMSVSALDSWHRIGEMMASPVEKLATCARFLYRLSFFVALVSCFFAVSGVVALVLQGERRKVWMYHITRFFSRCWNYGFRIKVRVTGEPISSQAKLVVSNHLSYLDIPVISAALPCLFVTSMEIRNTPFLGHVCRLASCLFVERRSRAHIGAEVSSINKTLRQGLNVGLFPESTSSDGSGVLPFKKGLLGAACAPNVQILPVCLNYTAIDDEEVTIRNRDLVCWYGDMSFGSHFFRFLCLKKVAVRVIIGKSRAMSPTDSRAQVAEALRGEILLHHSPIR